MKRISREKRIRHENGTNPLLNPSILNIVNVCNVCVMYCTGEDVAEVAGKTPRYANPQNSKIYPT